MWIVKREKRGGESITFHGKRPKILNKIAVA
jgi:hypothetical protein